MKNIFSTILMTVAFVAVPAVVSAATYQYVDNVGQIRTVNANTAQEAIMTAPNIADKSGVMIIDSPVDVIPTNITVVNPNM